MGNVSRETEKGRGREGEIRCKMRREKKGDVV